MIVMGLEFMNDVPFRDVLIHGLVRDAQGRKMSKSLGNGIDPLEVIAEYGADALRFNLVIGVAPGNDMRFIPEKVEAYRNFANKIWNASRFALMNLEGFTPAESFEGLELTLPDKWILSRFEYTASELTRLLERYDIGEGARVLYDFIWSELCDWYIELAKPRLYGRYGDAARLAAQQTLWYVLKNTLQLLHPYMPFITEEIWQNLPHEGETIVRAPWPTPGGFRSEKIEAAMSIVMDVVTEIRTVRSEKNVPPGRKITAICQADPAEQAILEENRDNIMTLAGLETLEITGLGEKPAKSIGAIVRGIGVFLPLAGMVDLEEERNRIARDLAQAEKELQRAQSKLANEGFVSKAPEEVVAKEREKEANLRATVERLQKLLAEMQE